MEKRCNQCKLKLAGRKKGREHGEQTGHEYNPMIACLGCYEAFKKQKMYKAHLPLCPARVDITFPSLAKPVVDLSTCASTTSTRMVSATGPSVTALRASMPARELVADPSPLVTQAQATADAGPLPSRATSKEALPVKPLSPEEDHPPSTPRAGMTGLLRNVFTDSEAPVSRYHCRSCFQDPCVEPVVTVCGHIFCQSCIVDELSVGTGCPACKTLFFIKLDV
ncbi:hypothetical protein BC628DRAFT_925101 [Trametes gibbosa]|uniref:Zinc finger protein 198 n=1 Tax=Trametes gibbosa TaxID=160864 RepID=A0A6B9KJK8_9APHY|nr:hypothetical protein BC628DRAFT_925101 [Trametes gibbosa]QHA24571.1 zinc finger protein 198 [Trametes gibbosa]